MNQTGYRDHPRLRGEYTLTGLAGDLASGSPPLARGIPGGLVWLRRSFGITPACAGNTWYYKRCNIKPWDHPRLRGEYDPIHRGE